MNISSSFFFCNFLFFFSFCYRWVYIFLCSIRLLFQVSYDNIILLQPIYRWNWEPFGDKVICQSWLLFGIELLWLSVLGSIHDWTINDSLIVSNSILIEIHFDWYNLNWFNLDLFNLDWSKFQVMFYSVGQNFQSWLRLMRKKFCFMITTCQSWLLFVTKIDDCQLKNLSVLKVSFLNWKL